MNRIGSERRLIELHKRAMQKKGHQLAILSEFDCSNGIADLVIVKLKRNLKRSKSIRHINPRWLYALSQLPYRKVFTLSEFSAMTGVTARRARSAVSEFCATGYCTPGSRKDTWLKIYQPKAIASHIVAIEAKLSNWRRALSQADRYLDFANQAWVLMDHASSKSAVENLPKFKRLNIGLMVMSKKDGLSVKFRPRSSPARMLMRVWQANGAVASRLRR